jgi:hypothetical protein
MKNEPLFKYVAAAGLAALVLAFAGSAHALDSGEVTRSGTYTTSRGASGTTSSVTTRSDGVVTRQGSWTNASGGKGTWQSQSTWDKETKTATITGSATRPNGATVSWQATATRTAPGLISEKGTITRANGKQSTFTGTRTRLAPGSWDKEETITTAGGATIHRSVTSTVAEGKGTRTVKTTLPDGTIVTKSETFTEDGPAAPSRAPAS